MKLNRVYGVEWITALAGVALLAATFLPFSGGRSAMESMSVTAAILVLAAAAALILPLVVAASATTNVPMVYETFVATFGTLVIVLVLIRLVWHPGDGLATGAWLATVASVVLGVWAWKSVTRGG